ncbi:hypothetical protein GGD54_000750 [Rhizobium tropici]|uniref:Uncharacterized protein n=1 Tax=Rhizobium tropici TaxID=398 RepID=A0ABR6QUK3_RHITR|nr:hypothetical protein [Rhizobium tropici]MBB5591307.1 hypothetical protein [Rhizobium tropici]MBB6490609.1 hypothetical protein [Rhizobium tropici]
MEYFHDLGLLRVRMALGCIGVLPVFAIKSHYTR